MSRLDLARMVANAAAPAVTASAPHTSTRYGTACGDAAAGGTVEVLLDGSGESVTLATKTDVAKGERVSVVADGGSYTLLALRSIGDGVAGTREQLETYIESATLGKADGYHTVVAAGGVEVYKADKLLGTLACYPGSDTLYIYGAGSVQVASDNGSDTGLSVMTGDARIALGGYGVGSRQDNGTRKVTTWLKGAYLDMRGLAVCDYDADWVDGVHVRRFGGVVVLDFAMTLPNGIDAGAAHVVGTLAAGFRPVGTVARGALVTSTRDDAHAFVRPSGEVGIYTHQGVDAPANLNGQVVFFSQQ